MLLAIDVGNTNIVFAVFDGDTPRDAWRLHTYARRCGDEYAVFLHQVLGMAGLCFADMDDVVISSVVPETHFHLEGFCKKHLHLVPVFITKDHVPITIDMERPEDVGADRLVNALAVKMHYGERVGTSGAIVIDFGTATTFDVIDASGAYAGGAIAPGIDLSVNALHSAASKLPKIGVRKPAQAIGKTTVEAMRSGVYWGYVGLIERITGQISAELGTKKPFVLATGGLATLFEDAGVIDLIDPDLTLKGLLEIYKGMSS
ncbi:MAG: type III pantothenate kinase [Rhodospirillales bacterium]|nr:type III pantothenate kinase [Rhodospirillales bacterium]